MAVINTGMLDYEAPGWASRDLLRAQNFTFRSYTIIVQDARHTELEERGRATTPKDKHRK